MALYPLQRDHPIPEGVWVPRGVETAAAHARQLYARHEAEIATVVELRRRLLEAARADRGAYRHAAAAGEDMPEPTEPTVREQLAEAERRSAAVEQAVRDALAAQAQAVAAHYDEWIGHLRGDLGERATEISALLDQLGDAFAALEAEARIVRTLGDFDGQPRSLRIPATDATREARLRDRAEKVEARRGANRFASSSYVDNTRFALVAALRTLVTEAAGRPR